MSVTNEYTKLFQQGAELTVVYCDATGELRERNVHVEYRYTSKDGNVVAKVWCYLRNDRRDLRLDRVVWASPRSACTPAMMSVPPGCDTYLTAVA